VLGVAVVATSTASAACEVLSGLSSLREGATDAGDSLTSADGAGKTGGDPDPINGTTTGDGASAADARIDDGRVDDGGAGVDVRPSGFSLLTVTIKGTNRGSISSNPQGIACGGAFPDGGPATACVSAFPPGTHVVLTAVVPIAFSWSGDCASATDIYSCELVMDSDKQVIGEFASY
jgi:hypothetical protein